MIPAHGAGGNLPPGEHTASWDELYARLGRNDRRRYLLDGLWNAIQALRTANVPRIYIDGSLITMKEEPGNFDACWDHDDQTDLDRLDPLFWHPASLAFPRLAQKARFGGEIFPASAVADDEGTTYRHFFQRDKYTNEPKGIVVINLRAEEL